ncbi:type IV toxin-antitoxin system AbiEi family antitoxin domain-containing protein [Patescibacteria group bacterium]|nr:type IV toxin-antitoxin system AbiEi family antitoxin domain-containing protein [Patescibacteria group bacterium]
MKRDKLNLLLKSPNNLFHTKDLALLWGITKKNTLYMTIRRYVKREVLIRVQKGFYSKVPLGQLSQLELGAGFLHSFCYISTETILSQKGLISQEIPYITLISDQSKKFKIGSSLYISRKMKDNFLFNEIGIERKQNILQASLERAVADMLYFNPMYHFDADKLIDWEKVKKIQEIIGYKRK